MRDDATGAEPIETREKGRVSSAADPLQTKENGTGWTRVGRNKTSYADKAKWYAETTQNRQNGIMGNSSEVIKQREVREKRQVGYDSGRIKDKIVVIGSSMVRNVERNVYMKEEGSYSRSIRGAGIKDMFIKPHKFLIEKRDNVSCTSAHLIRSKKKN